MSTILQNRLFLSFLDESGILTPSLEKAFSGFQEKYPLAPHKDESEVSNYSINGD